MRLLRYKRLWLVLLLPASYLLVCIAKAYPAWTEIWYSTGIYPLLAGGLGRLSSLLPFSLAELCVALLCVGVPLLLARFVLRVRREKERRRELVAGGAAALAAVAAVAYALFVLFCGLNYHRLSFAQQSGLEVRDSSAEELARLCAELAGEANRLRLLVQEDGDGVMSLSFPAYSAAAKAAQAEYGNLAERYPFLGGYTPRPKPVVLSRAMSRMNITGIYIPFTFEATVNVDTPSYGIPATMMHEISHFKGFMREDEANFLAYLACAASNDNDFAYSGTMLALAHSTNALYSADRDLYYWIMESLDDGVLRDFAANRAYWKQFEGPVAEVSTAVNNAYLRANNQRHGVKSYGRMVDLLLAEYRQRYGME